MDTTPTNLTDFILSEVHRQTSEAALRATVEAKIAATVKDAVDRAFSYGDLRKQIDTAVQDSLRIGGTVDVPAYGTMVLALLRTKMDETLATLVNDRLSAEMADILSIAPKEVRLHDVVEKMIADLDPEDRHGTHVTCIVEESSAGSKGWHHVYLDERENVRKYDCRVGMGISDKGEIYHLAIGNRDAKKTIVMGPYYGWEKMIFAAYCCGSKFIVGDGDPSTGIGDF